MCEKKSGLPPCGRWSWVGWTKIKPAGLAPARPFLLTLQLMSKLKLWSNKKALHYRARLYFVGVAGFEPAASCSQSRRDNRATLHPETNDFVVKSQIFKFQFPKKNFQTFKPWTFTFELWTEFVRTYRLSGCKYNSFYSNHIYNRVNIFKNPLNTSFWTIRQIFFTLCLKN